MGLKSVNKFSGKIKRWKVKEEKERKKRKILQPPVTDLTTCRSGTHRVEEMRGRSKSEI